MFVFRFSLIFIQCEADRATQFRTKSLETKFTLIREIEIEIRFLSWLSAVDSDDGG